MTDYARKMDDRWVLLQGAFTVENAGVSVIAVDPNEPNGEQRQVAYDLQMPHNWLEISTPEDRAQYGIEEVAPPDPPPAGHHTLGLEVVDVGGLPKYSYRVEAVTLADAKALALSHLANARWDATQHFTYDGVRTKADGAFAVITARMEMRRQLEISDETPMQFKLANGEFRAWTKAGEVAFGAALSQHIQGCFDAENLATGAIAAAQTAAAALAIPDAVEWP